VPTTSVDSYAATMAQWFGLTDNNVLNNIFPYVHNFTTKLGFLNLS
jgi:uncharacterized protein (DUF1501 family)